MQETFDVVITGDGSVEYVNELLKATGHSRRQSRHFSRLHISSMLDLNMTEPS